MSLPPSMVHRSGNRLVVRSVVSGDKLYGSSEADEDDGGGDGPDAASDAAVDCSPADAGPPSSCPPPADCDKGRRLEVAGLLDEELPQCKVKRNYACSSCSYYTQNPRYYLHHLKNVHKEKIRIYECPHCLYASKHSQKLQRHIHMVHVMGKRKLLIKAKSSASPPGGASPRSSDDLSVPAADLAPMQSATIECRGVEAPLDDLEPEPEVAEPPSPSPAEAEPENTQPAEEAAADSAAAGPLQCSLCSFSSRNPNLVTRHERLVHLKKKFYRCTKCDYMTHMKARFTKHVKYHSMPMIKCEMCDFRTPYKWNLDRHNKNHFANGAFRCSLCNFTADIKQSLTVHEMNHHVPPVNQGGAAGAPPTPAKRRCRVGASDVMEREEVAATTITPIPTPAPRPATPVTVEPDLDELELLRMERESLQGMPVELELDGSAMTSEDVAQMAAVEITMLKPNNVASNSNSGGCKTLNLKNPTAAAYLKGALKPEDVILTKNGSVYVKRFKCRVCQYKAAWESEMVRHEARVHGLDQSKKKPLPRPIPNLIPIQSNGAKETPPVTRNGALPEEHSITERDLDDLYAKSCTSSALKDFASLIGTEEAHVEGADCCGDGKVEPARASPPEADSKSVAVPESFKKKNASFFDRLKEKLMGGAGENNNLACWCGHKSKCLSESVMHQKTHSEAEKSDKAVQNGPMISGAELSSTRCQHCRHRCKTSSDLFVHLQSCPRMIKKEDDLVNGPIAGGNSNDLLRANHVDEAPTEEDGEVEDELDDGEKSSEHIDSKLPKEEQKVFVWNNFSVDKAEENEDMADDDSRCRSPASESSLVGYEIAPGIGSVLPNNNEDNAESFKTSSANIDINSTDGVSKKVFKCPHCSFWASTASRFHVHIVSHMNVKPFGCSVCPYQSKWKWDVTKHIKLKKERDPVHESAEIQTIDMETGRRNYTKYNRHLTIMRVHEPQLDVAVAKSSSSTSASTSTITSTVSNPASSSSSVPVLPRLTPAPSMNGEAEKGAAPPTTDVSLRPLPPLHPGNPIVGVKRPHDGGDDSEIPKKKLPSEKKMWKCKKCKFRNTDRNVVLAHVKEHYVNGSQNRTDSSKTANDGDSSQSLPEPTNRTDNQDTVNDRSSIKNSNTPEHASSNSSYEANGSSNFLSNESQHVDSPQAPHKCCFCSFQTHEKETLSEHITSHGVENVDETVSSIINNRVTANGDEASESCDESTVNAVDDGTNKSDSAAIDEMERNKRFKCNCCPYVTNNKSQYLYHKQFHRLRNAPFKCNICSYNVTKRHLLHQHLKIHGVKRAQFKNCIKDAVEREEPDESFTLNTDIETSDLPDIPLVWVHKAGALTKMFKCRHCPHVNLRKSNIHEHEKMHFDRVQRSPNGSIASNQMSTHHCTECNYVCNNAGALASHFKVHQGAFGQICALADTRRSDESQIREITRLLNEDERFKKDAAPAQPSPRPEDADELRKSDADVLTDGASCGLDSSNASVCSQPATPTRTPSRGSAEKRILNFCNTCPARFISPKDLESHSRFHSAHHMFKCNSCTYSAPQQAQLLAHKRVHTNEYQDKTQQMCAIYECSNENPRPRTALIPDKPDFPSLGWVVVHTSPKKPEDSGTPAAAPRTRVVTKQFACHKCPAKFFKSAALQHHLTLHGGNDQYQCRSCDYRVKTYGNLIKHEAVHGLEPIKKSKSRKRPSNGGSTTCSFPTSGTELFQHRSEQLIKVQTSAPINPISIGRNIARATTLTVDPEFGNLIHGSPDFMYQPTLKKGKMKEKRYKCHKCPSGFEKREQYKKHVSLHGAKSKFKCEKCDYSVSNYANYKQHMRKHDWNERSLSERRASVLSKGSDGATPQPELSSLDASTSTNFGEAIDLRSVGKVEVAAASPEKSAAHQLTSPAKAAKTLHISVADQQAVVLMQQRLTDTGVNMADQLHRCYYCPYSHQRRDAVEIHEQRCHINSRGAYVCEFCNYTVPQPHFLREHQKLHFGFMKGIKPEAYMKCDRLEIWMETENGKVLIFKDSGSSAREEDRFQPKAEPNDEQPQYEKMYVDVTTGEEYVPQAVEPKVESEESPESAAHLSAPAPRVLPHPRQSLRMLSANGGLSSQSTSASASPSKLEDEDAMAADAVVKSETFDEDLADDLAFENSSLVNDIMDMDDDDDDDELEANADGVASVGVGSSALDVDHGSEFMDDDDLEADVAEEEMSQQNGGDLYFEDQMKSEPEDAKSELEEDAAEPDEPAPTGLTRKNGTKLRIDMAAVAAAAAAARAASSEDSDSNDSDSSSSSSSSSSSCSGSSCSSSDSSYLSSDDEKIEEAKDIKSVAEDEEMEESIANGEASLSVVNPPQKS